MSGVPLPGVNPAAFRQVFGDNPFNNVFTIISGGRLDQPSLVAIGVAPFINASIIIQLLTTVIPRLEDLNKQGEIGRRTLNQYTRLLTIPLSIVQSIMIYSILINPSFVGGVAGANNLLKPLHGGPLVALILTLAAGSILLMWIGELITENGIGNGASVIIAFGIISSLPRLILGEINGLNSDWQSVLSGNYRALFSNSFLLFYLVIFIIIVMIFLIIYVSEAVRKIAVMYAKRVRVGNSAESYLPIKLNQAGVMPVIFAQALLTFPQIISSFVLSIKSAGRLHDWATLVSNWEILKITSISHVIAFILLIIAFTYFYTYVVVKPEELAKNLQKSGAFIPGVRPGNGTVSYLNSVTLKLTMFGAVFLAIIAIIPSLLNIFEGSQRFTILSGIGGTSLLIVVGVFMDSYRKMQSLKSVQSYESFR